MNLRGNIILFVLMSLSSVAVASEHSPYDQIDALTIGVNGVIYVYPDGGAIDPAGCGNTTRYTMTKSHSAYDEIYEMILMAFETGKRIRFDIYSGSCNGGSPKIRNARALSY